jgi:hypothetical protein
MRLPLIASGANLLFYFDGSAKKMPSTVSKLIAARDLAKFNQTHSRFLSWCRRLDFNAIKLSRGDNGFKPRDAKLLQTH